jgi:hypothetical protein
MDLAESLYHIHVEDKSWIQHTDHQEQIIALQAEIKTLNPTKTLPHATAIIETQTGNNVKRGKTKRERTKLRKAIKGQLSRW